MGRPRPQVGLDEVRRVVRQAAANRRKVGDPDLWRLPDDTDDPDVRGVLDYLARYSGSHIPGWVLRAEVPIALTLLNWLWWEDQRRLSQWLATGRRRGHFLSELGAQLGIASRQGVEALADRLTALLATGRPDQAVARELRAAGRVNDGAAAWVAEQAARIGEASRLLTVAADQLGLARAGDPDPDVDDGLLEDGDRDWIDQLADDVAAGVWTPGLMSTLNLAVLDLRTARATVELDVPRPHRAVAAACAAADALRVEFAELGKRAGPPAKSRRNRPVRFLRDPDS